MDTTNVSPEVFVEFEKIAGARAGVETLTGRGRDHLDFHDVGVDALVLMLADAFELGRQSAC